MKSETRKKTEHDVMQNAKPEEGAKSKMKPKTKRTLVALLVVVFVCVGLAVHTGTGTLSMAGIASVATLCPLGALEVAIASRTIVPVGVIGFVIVILLALLIGRGFCGWLCPTNLMRRLFGIKTPYEKRELAKKKARKNAKFVSDKENAKDAKCAKGEKDTKDAKGEKADCSLNENTALARIFSITKESDVPSSTRGGVNDSRMWVLGGVLLSTAAFGFPVFCLICPVGLAFATVICLWQAFQFGQATLSLLVFPAILIIEVVVLRKWCHTLCPIGALLSLISRGNKTFNATINKNACMESSGHACGKCVDVCPEGIDLHDGRTSTRKTECLKCGECKFACPMNAISFPFLPRKGEPTSKNETLQTKEIKTEEVRVNKQ